MTHRRQAMRQIIIGAIQRTIPGAAVAGMDVTVTETVGDNATHSWSGSVLSLADRIHTALYGKGDDGAADFFQPGHTYSDSGGYDWKFRVDTVTTHPEDGERTALGWRFFNGEWEPYAYGEDDFEIHQLVGHLNATEAGEGR